MTASQPKNQLHGITLQQLLTELVECYGWEEMGRRTKINCFVSDPTVSSSLKFLRRTPWARKKVEELYLRGTAARGRKKRAKDQAAKAKESD